MTPFHPSNRSGVRILARIFEHPAMVAAIGLFWLAVAALQEGLFVDEARWSYVARLWIHGTPPYKGVVENKPPGIFLVMAIGEFLFGPQYWFPRLIGIAAVVATSVVLYRVGKTWRDHGTGLMAMVLFLFASAWVPFEGSHPAETETFINLFSTLAFYWVAVANPNELARRSRLVVAGMFMGASIAFKQIAVATATALGIFVVDVQKRQEAPPGQSRRSVLWVGAGILMATLMTWIPIAVSGVSLHDYMQGAWLLLFNAGDFGQFPGSSALWSVRLDKFHFWLGRPDTYLFLFCLVYLWAKRKSLETRKVPVLGLLAWMILDDLGVHGSGYYFPHQFRQALPSLALSGALSFDGIIESFHFRTPRTKDLFQLATTWLLLAMMVGAPQMPSAIRAWDRVTRPMVSPAQQVGRWLQSHTQPTDYVYMTQENSDLVQFYSGRRSSSRYYNTYYIDAAAIPEVTEDLTTKRPPRFIVLFDNQAPDWLWAIISNAYAYRFDKARYWIYEKINYITTPS